MDVAHFVKTAAVMRPDFKRRSVAGPHESIQKRGKYHRHAHSNDHGQQNDGRRILTILHNSHSSVENRRNGIRDVVLHQKLPESERSTPGQFHASTSGAANHSFSIQTTACTCVDELEARRLSRRKQAPDWAHGKNVCTSLDVGCIVLRYILRGRKVGVGFVHDDRDGAHGFEQVEDAFQVAFYRQYR